MEKEWASGVEVLKALMSKKATQCDIIKTPDSGVFIIRIYYKGFSILI